MSPANDDLLNDIRHATDRLKAAGRPYAESDIAAELGITTTRLHAVMRQLFSDGRRIEPDPSGQPARDES